ncbi:porin [Caulobacter sp. CCG-8]|uniref:OprO/OprP family phosphate-selective porin n=1 Tax=Caulobacter sp. CCG-8 TaxID=3127958 RepID=UPI00307FB197
MGANLEASHDPRPPPRRRRPRLTLALLVAAALATTEAPAEAARPPATTPSAEQAPQQQPTAEDQAEAPHALLVVPLKLLSVLDQDFSLGPWTFRGYIQLDGANYTQPAAGPPETDFRRGAIGSGDTLDARALADGSYLRKARLGGEGQWGENLSYRAMFDIGGRDEHGEARVAEVWARYSRFAPWVFIAGAYPQLTNMEDATSTDANPFLERATAANLARGLGGGDGRLGVTVRRATRNWMTAVSLTGPVLHEDDETSPKSAVIVRTSRAFYPSADSSYHLGGSLIYVLSPGDPQDGRTPGFGVRLQATPEVRVDDTPLLDTGDIVAHHVRVLGLEFAARRRNLFLQAEAFHFAVERSSRDLPRDPRFFGFYIEGSWMLTGEARRFDQTRAVFGRPLTRRPLRAGGWGAWELAARYSRMDANSYAGAPGAPPPPGGVRGGDQAILSLALNWYPSNRIRLMLNAMHVKVDRLNPASPADPEPFGPAPTTPPVGVQIGQTLDVVAMRLRYAF